MGRPRPGKPAAGIESLHKRGRNEGLLPRDPRIPGAARPGVAGPGETVRRPTATQSPNSLFNTHLLLKCPCCCVRAQICNDAALGVKPGISPVPTDQGQAGGRWTLNNQEFGSCPRAAVEGVVQAGGMEIIVDIHLAEDGRPSGTAQAAGSSDARSFSGNLEFMAVMESL